MKLALAIALLFVASTANADMFDRLSDSMESITGTGLTRSEYDTQPVEVVFQPTMPDRVW